MKKLKWFLLVLVIFLMIIIVIGSCKKTKALENSFYSNDYSYITSSDSNSCAIFYYTPSTYNTQDLLVINYNDGFNSGVILMTFYHSSIDYLGIYIEDNGGLSGGNYSTLSVTTTGLCYFYFIAGSTSVGNQARFVIQYGYVRYDGTDFRDYNSIYYFNNIPGQNYDIINDAYSLSSGMVLHPCYSSYKGMTNGYILDSLDYGDTFSEYVDDIKSDYLINSFIYSSLYQEGYDVGYREGYDAGYTLGQRNGYNAGYSAGYEAGIYDNAEAYDRGFDAGYSMGYSAGLIDGWDAGYNTGYTDGYNNGLSGATPASQAVTLIGSIFASIGSVLAIQLFPGFSLGLLILVPLFFAVLGLILWIWRRN